MKFKNVILMPILVVLFFVYVNSMKCYQCRSDIDEDCNDIKKKHLQECTPQHNSSEEEDDGYCRKTVQKLHFLKERKTVTIRECALIYEEHTCYKMLSPDATVKSCDCIGEGCNVATKLQKSVVNCLFVIVASLIVQFFPP